jgi:hypothetical protein
MCDFMRRLIRSLFGGASSNVPDLTNGPTSGPTSRTNIAIETYFTEIVETHPRTLSLQVAFARDKSSSLRNHRETETMADSSSTIPESGNGTSITTSPPPANKVAAQLTKLRDANTRYKNLLKMAKERIEQQELELKRLKGTHDNLGNRHVRFCSL